MDKIWKEAQRTLRAMKKNNQLITTEAMLCFLSDKIGNTKNEVLRDDFIKLALLLSSVNDIVNEISSCDYKELPIIVQAIVDRLQAMDFIEPRKLVWMIGGLIYAIHDIVPIYTEWD